jgi:hypothetical protein
MATFREKPNKNIPDNKNSLLFLAMNEVIMTIVLHQSRCSLQDKKNSQSKNLFLRKKKYLEK